MSLCVTFGHYWLKLVDMSLNGCKFIKIGKLWSNETKLVKSGIFLKTFIIYQNSSKSFLEISKWVKMAQVGLQINRTKKGST